MADSGLDAFLALIGEGLALSEDEIAFIEAIFLCTKASLGESEIQAEVFRRLCMHADRVRGGQPGRFRVEGGRISGRNLELTGLRLDFGLQFKGTELPRLICRTPGCWLWNCWAEAPRASTPTASRSPTTW